MGYSLDSSLNTTIVDAKTVSAKVSAAVGAHTLHVKAWGNQGASCSTNVAITVKAASSGTVSDGITIASPGNGASVTSPFTLGASASTCASQTVTALGYSLDNSSATTIVKSTTMAATVTSGTGAHTVHVKSWGNKGSACSADVAITVTSSTTATVNGISVTAPGNGASVSSPFDLAAKSSTCSSQTVTAMGYSLDSDSTTMTVGGTTVSAAVSAAVGAHTVHVKSWGNKGAACDTPVAVTVNNTTLTVASILPSDAVSVSAIQAMGAWWAINDAGTSGSASGSTGVTESPAMSGHARKFATSFSNSGAERYSISFGDDMGLTNFLYDGWVYIASPSSGIANIEMDMNQTMPNGQTAIFGVQCDGYTTRGITRRMRGVRRVRLTSGCIRARIAIHAAGARIPGTVQIYYSRDRLGEHCVSLGVAGWAGGEHWRDGEFGFRAGMGSDAADELPGGWPGVGQRDGLPGPACGLSLVARVVLTLNPLSAGPGGGFAFCGAVGAICAGLRGTIDRDG